MRESIIEGRLKRAVMSGQWKRTDWRRLVGKKQGYLDKG